VVGDGPAREKLERDAAPGVSFLGERRGAELAEIYASADVFCFPSTTDTFGQVLLEAASSGLPVVAAAVGGAPELVRHGKTGLLGPPADARALQAALRSLALDTSRRRRLGAAGERAARQRTWSRSFEELRRGYVVATGTGDAPRRIAAAA